MKKITINKNDNVQIQVGGELDGHKIAKRDIAKGEQIIKYGYPIGTATSCIKKGEHVHTHNVKTNLSGILDYEYAPKLKNIKRLEDVYFDGFLREDGSVGIRNEIWIINTVGCVNKTAGIIAKKANELYQGRTEGIFTFEHPFGCSQLGDDHKYTQLILKGLVNNPNAGGVLILGLGCENNNIIEFKKILGEYNQKRVKFLNVQDVENEIDKAVEIIKDLVDYAEGFSRVKCPVSKLIVGLKCGGSDGFSGITANPLAGLFSDMLIDRGGSTILTEVPEMFGAETILMNRCINRDIFNKTVNLINDFKEYFIRYNQEVYENPSPGNKKGGITTLEDKSLGCIQKGGTSNVSDVIKTGEKLVNPGLNLLSGPGNDIVAITNLAAAGCQLILFTTGRGTPVGAPVPTIKISSNTNLALRKPHWIDFDAGSIIDNFDLSNDLFNYVIKVASGEKTLNEKNGYREISIFKDGVTL